MSGNVEPLPASRCICRCSFFPQPSPKRCHPERRRAGVEGPAVAFAVVSFYAFILTLSIVEEKPATGWPKREVAVRHENLCVCGPPYACPCVSVSSHGRYGRSSKPQKHCYCSAVTTTRLS